MLEAVRKLPGGQQELPDIDGINTESLNGQYDTTSTDLYILLFYRACTICARSILAWPLGIDRHGVHSWRRLRFLDTLRRERERCTMCLDYDL